MTTKNCTHEQISALADGEVAEDQFDSVLAALKTPEGRETWKQYHEIGDVLRSDDMAISMSSDFTSRLMARLDNEPTVVAPIVIESTPADTKQATSKAPVLGLGKKRFALSGIAAAAVAALAFVAVPQVMVATKGGPAIEGNGVIAAATTEPKTIAASNPEATAGDGDILRNADVDEYLLAHQRFSPSVYSAAQYARSATFAVDSEK